MQLIINQRKKIVKELENSGKKLIYIAWASASGKSYFAKKLWEWLEENGKKVLKISSDDYYSDQTNLQYLLYGTFDHPNLIEYDLLQKNLNEYFEKWSTKIPVYSFKESRRIDYKKISWTYDYIIVEGLYTIEKLNNKNNPLKIFVDSHTEELIFRRIIRDQTRFRDTIESIIGMIGKVFPMWTLYGTPQKKAADLIIHNDYEIMAKEGEKISFKLLNKKPSPKWKLTKKLYIYDFIYNDENDDNGIIYVSEVYEKKWWLLKHIIITKSKKDDAQQKKYKRIIVPLYKAGSLTMIHSLLQNGGLKLIDKNHKEEYSYETKEGEKTHYKKSRGKRYIIEQ